MIRLNLYQIEIDAAGIVKEDNQLKMHEGVWLVRPRLRIPSKGHLSAIVQYYNSFGSMNWDEKKPKFDLSTLLFNWTIFRDILETYSTSKMDEFQGRVQTAFHSPTTPLFSEFFVADFPEMHEKKCCLWHTKICKKIWSKLTPPFPSDYFPETHSFWWCHTPLMYEIGVVFLVRRLKKRSAKKVEKSKEELNDLYGTYYRLPIAIKCWQLLHLPQYS